MAVVGFAFFLVWELTDAHPVVDLQLFARRNLIFLGLIGRVWLERVPPRESGFGAAGAAGGAN